MTTVLNGYKPRTLGALPCRRTLASRAVLVSWLCRSHLLRVPVAARSPVTPVVVATSPLPAHLRPMATRVEPGARDERHDVAVEAAVGAASAVRAFCARRASDAYKFSAGFLVVHALPLAGLAIQGVAIY